MEEILLAFKVHRARNLPKTDVFSEIDPYIRVRFGDRIARTQTKQDEPAPDWEELLLVPGSVDLQSPGGEIQVELWDEELIDDDAVGVAKISLADFIKNPNVRREIGLEVLSKFKKRAKDLPATVWITTGFFLDYPGFLAALSEQRPGTFDVNHERCIYAPLFELGMAFYLQIGFARGAQRQLSLSVLVCEPNNEDHVDFALEGQQTPDVTRRDFDPPEERDGLRVYREIKIEGISPIDEIDRLAVMHARSTKEGAATIESLLSARGLADALGFKAARKAVEQMGLSDTILDEEERSVQFPFGDANLRVLFLGEEVKVEVDCYGHEDKFFDLKVDRGSVTRRQFVTTTGQRELQRMSVTELPIGKSVDHVVVEQRKVGEIEHWRLINLLPLRG